ncbi:phytoene/squalene synthase family protein [Aureimonas pseudogalii]|uniref:Phytoene synthase n=1 Tax=Aureimonas pseudogalii TaxID=1744844 RepID=A0A7W6EHJ7_9HYPH|nr:phytoene/squalene synthase family protein [Aureimonas pseudogalii]MBB3998294.1 phytoene synthase [Aureimonas pseudogalii]
MAEPGAARLDAAYAECERIVRDGDPDRAVSVGFAPADLQRHLNALYAFNVETARIRDLVSQPLPGEIRLQWWRDRIEAGVASDAREGDGSPVAEALLDTIRRFDLPAAAFEGWLEARIFDLYDDPMPSRADFEAYAGETASALIVLAAMVLDRAAASGITERAGHAGVAQAATGALRSAALHRSRNQVFLPTDLLAATGLDAGAWLRGGPETAPAEAAMRAFAAEHLARAEAEWHLVPRALRPALLPARLTRRYLTALEAGKGASTLSPLIRLWAYWRWMRG